MLSIRDNSAKIENITVCHLSLWWRWCQYITSWCFVLRRSMHTCWLTIIEIFHSLIWNKNSSLLRNSRLRALDAWRTGHPIIRSSFSSNKVSSPKIQSTIHRRHISACILNFVPIIISYHIQSVENCIRSEQIEVRQRRSLLRKRQRWNSTILQLNWLKRQV